MRKRLVTFLLVAMIALSSTACGFSRSVIKSDTGMISESVTNNNVKLNLVEHVFPEGCEIKTGKLTSPVGISVAQITKDGTVLGVLSDGYYSEDITEENILDAANVVLKEINDLKDDITTLSDDCVTKTDHLNIVSVRLSNGNAYFIVQLGTPNFAYVSQADNDDEDIMGEALKSVIKTLGGQKDLEALGTKLNATSEEKIEETTNDAESTEDKDLGTFSDASGDVDYYYVTFDEGKYPIAIPNAWETDQYETSFYTRVSKDIEVSYRDSYTKLDDEDGITTYYEILEDVYGEMTPVTLTIPCSDGTTVTAYAFTTTKDGYTKTKVLEPVKLDGTTFLTNYIEIDIADFSGEIDFASGDIDTFTTYVSQFLCAF